MMENDQLKSAISLVEVDVAAKLAQALADHQNGVFDAAATAYLEVLTQQPANAEALQMYATLQVQCGKPAEALELIDRAITAINSNAVAHFYRGNILRDLNRPQEALASYQLALKINPLFPGALYGCGNAWQDLNQPAEALANYDLALKLNPDLVEVLYNRGKMLQELKRPDAALLAYERVLQLNPALAEAHCALGDALRELKRPARALGSYERALQINPEFGVALYHRGEMLRELGRLDAALASYQKAFELYPDFVEALLKHADVLKDLKRHHESLAGYDHVVRLNPGRAEAYNNRGAVLLELHRYDEALADFDRTIAIDPHLDLPYVNRGKTLKAMARPEEGGKDVVWMPTSQALVDKMLDMAGVEANDFVIDLGSGDGRTVISAALRGAHALGIEFNPKLVEQSKHNALQSNVAERATFVRQDVFEADFSRATVLTMFLAPDPILKLRSKILDLQPGTRVVSNTFTISDWTPDETAVVEECAGSKVFFSAHLWIVPAKVEGRWRFDTGELTLRQNFQMAEGWLTFTDGAQLPLHNVKLRGKALSFQANATLYSGFVDGDLIGGTAVKDGATTSWVASRRDDQSADIRPQSI